MAEIKTAISIVDGFSPALRSLNNALNIVTSALADTQKELGKPIDLSSINAAKAELAQATSHLDRMGDEAQKAAAKQDKLGSSMENSENKASELTGKIKGLIAAYATWETASLAISTSDTLTNMGARLALINDGLQTQAELEDMIFAAAQRTSNSYVETAEIVSKLRMNAKDAFKTNEEAVLFAELLQKKFAIAGASADDISSVMTQLTQGLGAGVLRGDELNSVFEAAPNIIQSIADYLNVPISKIREMAEKGLLTADVVKKAMFASIEETNKQFNSMPDTFTAVWTRFKNEALRAFTPVLKRLNEFANSQSFKDLVSSGISALKKVATGVIWLGEIVAGTVSFIKSNLDLLAPIVLGVAAGFGIWGATLLYAKMQAIYTAAANGVLTASIILATFATQGFKAGMAALNVVMAMNPIMLIVLAVVALIAVFYLAVAAVNKFAGTSISATGIITGAFSALFTAIWNMVAYTVNTFLSFAEFFINVFQNPIYSIKALFVNLATNFIDTTIGMIIGWDKFATSFANAFLDAINWVIKGWNEFVDFLPDSVSETLGLGKGKEFEARTSMVMDLSGAKKQLNDMLGEKPEDYTTLERMKFKGVGLYAKSGYQWGANAAEKMDINGAIANTMGVGSDALASGANNPLLAGQQSALDKIAANTGRAADSLERPNEELKFLREIGEREAVYKLNTNEIKVDVSNNNNINSELDLDSIVSDLVNNIRGAMSTMAEGTHN